MAIAGTLADMEAPTKMKAERHTDPVPRPPRRNRNVRVEDELWDAALTAADEQNKKLSEEIRRFLEDYVKAHEKRKGGKR